MKEVLSGSRCFHGGLLGATLVFGIQLSGAGRATAHSDPWGDTHPQVQVVDGKFAIVFNSSLPDERENFTDEKKVFRTVYTAEGVLVAPRHPLKTKRSWRATGPAGLYGKQMQLGESALWLDSSRSGRPGYF